VEGQRERSYRQVIHAPQEAALSALPKMMFGYRNNFGQSSTPIGIDNGSHYHNGANSVISSAVSGTAIPFRSFFVGPTSVDHELAVALGRRVTFRTGTRIFCAIDKRTFCRVFE
jgi:hypothetical protein